ncbi:MAG: undecaprenyldiphospho-muramoylpentapeptide beta-N-acetylglucosaminyltransferase [Candidatus Omnitrophota bacterium]
MRILAVTGASGGHIFPALGLIDALAEKEPDIQALLVLPKRNFIADSFFHGYSVRYVSIANLTFRPLLRAWRSIWNFFKGCLESFFILLEFRPNAVVGFGSIASVPMVMLAWVFRIKTIIHEQNVSPGKANRFLSLFIDKVAISFAEGKSYFPPEKVVITGNPLRRALKKVDRKVALETFGLRADKFTIFIMGGSQGSSRLNEFCLKAISQLAANDRIQVIHLSGTKEYDHLKEGYKELNLDAWVFAFLKDVHLAYSCADLLISRAGASCIWEAIAFQVPAIIIPYPFAYKHQLNNALTLQDKGCAVIINDEELDSGALGGALKRLVNSKETLEEMRYNYKNLFLPDAAGLLAEQVVVQ